MTHLDLVSALSLFVAAAIPAYMALRVAGRRTYALLSLVLTLTLLLHALHHVLDWMEASLLSAVAGLLSALVAVGFALLYLNIWRSARAER